MKKTFTILTAALMLLAMFANPMRVMGQAPVGTTLWGETWTGGEANETPSDYGFEGTTVYGGATLTYAQSSTNTKLYDEALAGGVSPELLLSKSNQTWTINNIPTGQATGMALTFKSNKTTFDVTSTTTGITISGSQKSWTIAATSSVTTFNLTIKNTGSSNARIDDIVLSVTTAGGGSSTTPTTVTIDATGITNTDVYTSTAAGSLSATVKDNDNNTVSGATVTWTSSHTNVATINASGVVTLVAAGTTTITASYAGDATYSSSSATYNLEITDSTPSTGTTATLNIQSYAAANDWTNGTQYTTVTVTPVTFTAGGGTNTGKYYTSGYEWRYYQNESASITISVPQGYTLVNVKPTYNVNNGGVLKNGNTTIASGTTVSVSGTSVTFTVGNSGSATNGQVKFTNIDVNYVDDGGTQTTSDLAITNQSTDLTFDLYNSATAQVINYTTSSTGAITITPASPTTYFSYVHDATNKTITVTPLAVTPSAQTVTIEQEADENYYAGTATFTVSVTNSAPLANIAALTAQTAGNYNVALNNALVTYVNGTNAYIEDASGAVLLYHCAGDLLAGDKITGTASVTYTVYNNLPEVTDITLAEGYTITHNNTVTPAVVTIAELDANITSYISRYVKIENATVTSAFSNKNSTIEQDGSSIVLRDQNNTATLTTTANSTVTVTAHPSIFNTIKQIAVYEQSQIVEIQNPYINASNVSITCDATNGNISYTIEYEPSPVGTLTATVVAGYTISNLQLETPANGTIAFTCDANTTSTARTAEVTLAYTYGGSKAQVTATVTITQAAYVPAPTSDPFVRISNLTDLTDGSIVVIAARYNGEQIDGYKAMPSTMSEGKPTGVNFTSTTSGDDEILPTTITNDINDYYWIVNISEDNYKFTNANGDFISYGSSGTDFTKNGPKYAWSIARETSESTAMIAEYTGFVITNVTTNNRGFAFNGSVFGAYATSNLTSDSYNFFLDFFVQKETPTTATYYYSVNGTLSEEHTCAIGSTKTLETGTDLYSNFTFAGWTTNANDVSSPISSYTFNDEGPVTFYAVYAHNSNNYTRVFNETATADIDIIGPSIIPSFGLLDMDTYEIELVGASLCLIIEEGGQLIYSGEEVRVDYQKSITAPSGTWGQNDNTGWYAISSPTGRYSKTSEINDFEYFVADARRFDFFAYGEKCGWYNKLDAEHYVREVKAGYGYLYAREVGTMVVFHDDACHDDYNLTNLSYTSSRGTLAGLHCIGNPYTHNIYKGVGITGDLTTGYYALNEATGAWISTTDATAIVPTQAILVFVNKTDGTAAIHMTSDNSAPSSKANNDYIKFNVANSKYEDVAYAWFDNGEGLKKINHRNSEVPMLYIPRNNANYSIAYMSDNTDMFNLNFKAMTTGKYTLSVSEKGDFSYLHIYDRLTGEDIDMLNDDYSFIGAPSDNEARFIVRLSYSAGNGSDINTFAFQNGSDIIVNGEGELQIFDVMGRMVKNTVINGVETIAMPQGVYIFRLNENIQKIVVR